MNIIQFFVYQVENLADINLLLFKKPLPQNWFYQIQFIAIRSFLVN